MQLRRDVMLEQMQWSRWRAKITSDDKSDMPWVKVGPIPHFRRLTENMF